MIGNMYMNVSAHENSANNRPAHITMMNRYNSIHIIHEDLINQIESKK